MYKTESEIKSIWKTNRQGNTVTAYHSQQIDSGKQQLHAVNAHPRCHMTCEYGSDRTRYLTPVCIFTKQVLMGYNNPQQHINRISHVQHGTRSVHNNLQIISVIFSTYMVFVQN